MLQSADRDPRRNKLLQTLKADEYARIERHLQIVSFTTRQPVYEANDPITTVYFPLSGVLALVTLLEGGETLAVATIGNEGFVGHAVALGAGRMPYHVICKVSSSCAAMRADTFREQLRRIDVGVALRRAQARVAEQLLDDAQIGASFEQVRRK